MDSKPCCPSSSSRTKLKIPIHTIGVISTPPKGGISLRTGIKNGSVGQATRLYGSLFRLISGYHDRTIRKINSKIMTPNRGPRTQVAIFAAIAIVNLCNFLTHILSPLLNQSGVQISQAAAAIDRFLQRPRAKSAVLNTSQRINRSIRLLMNPFVCMREEIQ